MSFKELGLKYGTDKVFHHRYDRFYPREIEFIKQLRGVGILEIGLFEGASLKLWLEYFPDAWIYGMDIGSEGTLERATITKGDQSKPADLLKVLAAVRHPLYFINDDGSHCPEHQLLTFCHLFPALELGGVYIIEDVETSYWRRGQLYGYPTEYGYQHPKSIIEKFKLALDYINREYFSPEALAELKAILTEAGFTLQWCLDCVKSITFAHNCIVIRKIDNDSDRALMERPYHRASSLLPPT
jgi:hypothetical protein